MSDEITTQVAAMPASNNQIELTTPGGYLATIKGYVSGGDMEDMQRAMLENMKFKLDPATGAMDNTTQEISGTITMDRTKKAIELFVLSVNGSSDNVYQAVRDLPIIDYDFVMEKSQ